MIKDSLLLKALRGVNLDRPPIWLMRQAGRYQASYQSLRKKHTLAEMFHEEDLITRVTLLPIEELGVDAAILFSDILLPLEALGFSVTYEGGPQVTPKDFQIDKLSIPLFEELESQFSFIVHAIRDLKKTLKVPLIGFCGAPFTIASYLLEKDHHHLLKNTKRWLYQETKSFHKLLSILSDLVIAYATLQIKAGVDVIQIFDSWAGVLDEEAFKDCSSFYLRKIVAAIKSQGVPVIVFCRGSCLFVEELVDICPTAISFDWHKPLETLKMKVPSSIALQGNLDPDILKAPFKVIESKLHHILTSMQGEKRFIMNLGHGVTPDISEDAVKYLVDSLKAFYR
ncbi:MAG: uroporphyrinogen decarboxylase [Chlamydiota bacterium]